MESEARSQKPESPLHMHSAGGSLSPGDSRLGILRSWLADLKPGVSGRKALGLPLYEELPFVQRGEKLAVAIRFPEFIEKQVHGFIDGKRIQDFAQDPDLVQIAELRPGVLPCGSRSD